MLDKVNIPDRAITKQIEHMKGIFVFFVFFAKLTCIVFVGQNGHKPARDSIYSQF